MCFFFLFICKGGFLYPIFYAPFNVFFFFFSHVAWFSQCSMPLYLYFCLFCCVCVFVLSMLYDSLNVLLFFFSFFATVVLFCQYSMPLLMYFSFLLRLWLGFADFLCLFILLFHLCLWLCCDNVLCLFGCIDLFAACGSVLQTFYASLLYFSFLLCLSLGFANALCIFICILFLSFVSVALLCQCFMSL